MSTESKIGAAPSIPSEGVFDEIKKIDLNQINNKILKKALLRLRTEAEGTGHQAYYSKHSSHSSHDKGVW